MPKQRITRQMVVQAALELARQGGMEQVQVKNIAARLKCSVQPVYSYCQSMPALRAQVVQAAGQRLREFVTQQMDPQDPFRSVGLAHAAFARQEPNLYRIWFLRPRHGAQSLQQLYDAEADPAVADYLQAAQGLTAVQARQLHLDMMLYNVGVSFALTALGEAADPQQIAALLGRAYEAFLQAARGQQEKGEG